MGNAATVTKADDQLVKIPIQTVTRRRELCAADGCNSPVGIEQSGQQLTSLALTAAQVVHRNVLVVQDPHGAKCRLDAAVLEVADVATSHAR